MGKEHEAFGNRRNKMHTLFTRCSHMSCKEEEFGCNLLSRGVRGSIYIEVANFNSSSEEQANNLQLKWHYIKGLVNYTKYCIRRWMT